LHSFCAVVSFFVVYPPQSLRDSSPKGRTNPLRHGLRRATSPERGRFCSTYRQMPKSSPFGGAGCERSEQTERVIPRRAALSQKAARHLPFPSTTPPVKMRLERSAERDKREILNNNSAATTTTAASGGNREELLGQRPARCECRPRHDADAGCRNPEEAERI
jgi:hypothetical protein